MKVNKESFAAFIKSTRSRFLVAILLALVCAGTLIAASLSIYEVEIIADGKNKVVQTSETDAKELIKKEGYTLGKNDELDISKFKPGEDVESNKLVILRARNITIDDDGEKAKKVIAAATVKDALKKADVTVSKYDKVTPALDEKINDDITIKIKRAYVVEVVADGKTKSVNFVEGTVKDVLKLADVKLGENDEVSPALDEHLKSGSKVTVNRVTYKTREEKEKIKYSTVVKKTSALCVGQRKVKQSGVKGEKLIKYKDKIVDGKKIDSEVISTKVTKEPVNEIRLLGTKVKVLSASSTISEISLPSRYRLGSDGAPSFSAIKTITGVAKAYTCNYSSYKGSGGTASGVKARPGYIAVNPNQIPYGTEMYITSTDGKYVYGYCIAADTGGFAKAGTATCDLYMNTLSECYQWGSRRVNIYILRWGNGRV